MAGTSLEHRYRDYISCLNSRQHDHLNQYVHDPCIHNGSTLTVKDYADMIRYSGSVFEDLRYNLQHLLVNESGQTVGARILYTDVMMTGTFHRLKGNGKKVSFSENVFYQFRDGKIVEVWSVIDTATIQDQLEA